MPPALAKAAGPLLVALGAMLWATDAVFRVPALGRLDPTSLVFLEHAVALLVLAPFAWLRHRDGLAKLGARQWAAVAFVGIGGSALATVLFTAPTGYRTMLRAGCERQLATVRRAVSAGEHLPKWVWEEFRVSVSETTLSRILRALGYRKLSARPRHHAQAAGAVDAFKKRSPSAWTRSRATRGSIATG